MAYSINQAKKDAKKAVTNPVAAHKAVGGQLAKNKGAIAGGILGAGMGSLGMLAGARLGSKVQKGKLPTMNEIMGKGGGSSGGGGGAGGGATSGRPIRPEYQGISDPSGNLLDPFKMQAGPAVTAGTINQDNFANTGSLEALRARAMSGDQSPWLKMQLDKQGLEETGARDQAAQQAMSGAGLARSQLAMKGGLGGGSRERIAMGSARDMNATRQAISRAGQQDRLGLSIANDQTNMNILGQMPGMDLAFSNQKIDANKFDIGSKLDADNFNSKAQADASQWNAGNATQGRMGQNAFSQGVYGQDMGEWGAGKTADAIAASGNNGKPKTPFGLPALPWDEKALSYMPGMK